MHSSRRGALLWRCTRGRPVGCFASSFAGFVDANVGKSKQTYGTSCVVSGKTTDAAASFEASELDSVRTKPPLQSLHKAILAGEVSLPPSQKVQRNGRVITSFNVATGGMWRMPMPMLTKDGVSEDKCTDPCVQYHKVTIHDANLGKLVVKTLRKGMQVYVEGEMETRVFNDMETGVIKRDREIGIHASGKIMAWTEKGLVSIESPSF